MSLRRLPGLLGLCVTLAGAVAGCAQNTPQVTPPESPTVPVSKPVRRDVTDFVEALMRVASGGTALDPEVVTQLMGASRRTDTLDRLSAREREVMQLLARGYTAVGDKKNAIANWQIVLRNIPPNLSNRAPMYEESLKKLKQSS